MNQMQRKMTLDCCEKEFDMLPLSDSHLMSIKSESKFSGKEEIVIPFDSFDLTETDQQKVA